ncbi:MAG: hypothetical protein IT381_19140 [Deltaproteobacteria bacterium]|nr:hypothetical protein [Deltaproteobacteria bacterium]
MRAIAFGACFLAAAGAEAQIVSPGELSRAHESLDSLKSCTKCHESGRRLSADICLSCHKELKTRVDKGTGLHGRLNATERAQCQNCHHEHQGRDFPIVDWNEKKFDHALTGFVLKFKHEKVACKECHATKSVRADDIKAWITHHPKGRTFLGLGTTCAGCHDDPHAQKLGADCQSCHDEASWKVRGKFDHATTDFPLLGKHKRVACDKCHATKTGGGLDAAFPPVEHAACSSCHQDPHNKRFGQRCESCHTLDGWHTLKKGAVDREFHDKTRFPLVGAHAGVECASCHGPFKRGGAAKFKGLAFQTCASCHLDSHAGQLAAAACDRCHTVESFSPIRFKLADHKAYLLEDAHAAVGCGECHKETLRPQMLTASGGKVFRPSAVDFHPKHDRCESCHEDPHGGQFIGKKCDTCHTTQGFRPASGFVHDRDTAFALAGAHVTAPCSGCHLRPAKTAPVQFHGIDKACAACHQDVHFGQLGAACERCHDLSAFQPAARFDHQKTKFALDGKHAKLTCERCHPQVDVKGTRVQRFVPTPTTCEGCHKDPHGGAFKRFKP